MPSSPNYVRNYKQENGNDSPKRKKNLKDIMLIIILKEIN